MQAGPPGSSLDETPPRNDTPPVPSPASLRHPAHVTSSTPAKRITFFRSGDAQFGGVKMAIHRRSFKTFEALLDDLSQKVPLPFGVRTVTTPRGTHRIRRLDQLQDGGCYLCSDRRLAKPIDMEVAGKGPAVWHHSRPQSGRRKPSRPAEAPSATRCPRHPKRIVLVKNTDPALRRSVILSPRSTRSLRSFLEEVSELMSCHIRKLYTLDGHKIDSVQSLMQCPSVLVCVGREPFRPLLDSFRKNSDEKLPGLRNRSRSSIFSEESKKNVNFGLETKKSIIHPRPDSSNRSTRFSLSSEKSYPNDLNASPGNSGCAGTFPHTKGSLTNDDIEKKVLVNKDGSLSVQMRVRFRLLNDETLQWSTEIKKSAVGSECCLGKGQEPCNLQQGKSFSDPESISGCEAEDGYTTNLQESHCQNPCNHCQEYDIWKHPVHGDPAPSQSAPSSSSRSSSHKIIHKKESVESTCTMSCSSEEYTERVVEKATCIQQAAESRDTWVEFRSVNHCCSHRETCTPRPSQTHRHARPDSSGSVSSHQEQVSVKVNGVREIEERSISVISNTSKVLEALREDQDDEDLLLSASRASACSCMHNQKLKRAGCPEENLEQYKSTRTIKLNFSASSTSPIVSLTPRPPSKESSCTSCSSKPQKSSKTAPLEPDTFSHEAEHGNESEKWRKSGASSRQSLGCNGAVASDTDGTQGVQKRALSSRASRESKTSEHSCCVRVPPTALEGSNQHAVGEGDERPISNTSTGTQASGRSRSANGMSEAQVPEIPIKIGMVEMERETNPRSVSAASTRTNASARSAKSTRSECTTRTKTPEPENSGNPTKEVELGDRAASAGSFKSRAPEQSAESHRSVCSAYGGSVMGLIVSMSPGEGEAEENAISESDKTIASAQSEHNGSVARLVKSEDTNERVAEEIAGNVEERATSTVSVKSYTSAHTVTPKPEGVAENKRERAEDDLNRKKTDSTMSARVTVSERAFTPASATTPRKTVERPVSGMSNCTKSSASSKASTKPSAKLDNTNCEGTERVPSVTSAKSNSSVLSRKSNRLEGPAAAVELNGDIRPLMPEKRSASSLSLGSKASVKSGSSSKLIYNDLEEASDRVATPATPGPWQEGENRAGSLTLSVQATASGKVQKSSKCHCVTSERDGTPETEIDAERLGRAVSVKSVKSEHSDSVVTPTSMVPISNGVVKEQAANGAKERVRSTISERSLASAESTKSNGRSKSVTPKAPVLPMKGEAESFSQQAGTPASVSSEMASGSETEGASVKSSSARNSRKSKSEHYLHVHNDRTSSAISKASSKKSTSKHSPPASKTSKAAKNTKKLPSEAESGVDTVADEEVSSVGSRSSRKNYIGEATMSRPVSKASAHSINSKLAIKNHCITAADKRPKSNQSNTSSYLQVKAQEKKHESNGSVQIVETKSSRKIPMKDLKVEEALKPNSVSSQDCLSLSPPKQMCHRYNGPTMLLGNSGDSILSNSLSAADLQRKNSSSRLDIRRPKSVASGSMHNGVPQVTDNKSEKSRKSRARKGSSSSRQKVEDDLSELVPSSLPDTSPIEVVNEWLKKIPSESSIYEVGDNFEECCEWKEAVEGQKEQEDVTIDVTEGDQASEVGKQQWEKAKATDEGEEGTHTQEAAEPEHPGSTDLATSPGSEYLIRNSFPKGCHSSVQVMKVLLSSKLDRCNSLPEVSPVYGRKLSSSAQGLLDCLAKLQMVGSDQADLMVKSAKYQKVMDILQSLWLCDPLDCHQSRQKCQLKDHSPDDEYNPKSSSGVDVSGSSGESGKSTGTVDQAQKVEVVHGRITPVLEQDAQQEDTEFSDRTDNSLHALENASNSVTPDIASRVQGTPGGGERDTEKRQQDEEEGLASEQSIRSNECLKDVIETPSSSNKNSGNDSNQEKSLDEMDPEDTSSGTPPSDKRAQVAGKATQDPDPVWVLNLLQKLEKQFMAHYMTAMAEFKVRWDLDESVLLDTMINELKDEVHKRIQSSINQELIKIRSRAGRVPRPPMQIISRESTLQTEQRRQRLKVMRNKSIYSSLSRSEENFTATDYSDQRSEDEFCPCDACMKKKMVTKSIPPELVNPPPLMKDFDLRKILQKKVEPPQQEQTGQQGVLAQNKEEDKNLEVSKKEVGEENEDEEKKCTVEKSSEEEGQNKEREEGNKEVVEQEEETARDEVEKTVESEVEEVEAKNDIAGERDDEVEDTGEENEDKHRETDSGETTKDEGEDIGEGKTVEGSKGHTEGAGDQGCDIGDSKNEEGAKDEKNEEEGEEEEADDKKGELSKQAEDKSGRTGTERTDEKSETGGGDGVEADGQNSGTKAQDEKSRVEREEQDVEHGDEEEKQSNQDEDKKVRCGEEEGGIEETDGADDVNCGVEEEKELKNHLMRQITKSSMESQQGSMDRCTDFEPDRKCDDTITSNGNAKARSNHMYPASSEEQA